MKREQIFSVGCALLAAALYALNVPVSKLLLNDVPPTMMGVFRRRLSSTGEARLTRQELPYAVGMIVLDIAAPILLMVGLTRTTSANASLLNNFEIVATSIIALIVFHEAISRRLWLAIVLITLSSLLLSFEDASSLQFSAGSLFVLLACVCWGFENNCTRMMSAKDPLEIVVLKGFGSGFGSLVLALLAGEPFPPLTKLLPVLLLGFVAYGLSIFFYVYAQRTLGAARTSAYYAIAPFLGVGLSFLLFRQPPTSLFLTALALMALGTWLVTADAK